MLRGRHRTNWIDLPEGVIDQRSSGVVFGVTGCAPQRRAKRRRSSNGYGGHDAETQPQFFLPGTTSRPTGSVEHHQRNRIGLVAGSFRCAVAFHRKRPAETRARQVPRGAARRVAFVATNAATPQLPYTSMPSGTTSAYCTRSGTGVQCLPSLIALTTTFITVTR